MNKLKNETSPYLLQHANNPVHWYAWGNEALEKARAENKPILLSIGYAACHWCHVMAHESFEDNETAELMNALFINIKVDREERPDLDKIYQTTHYILTQQPGGWPLTVFLTPNDLSPFFSGTYFPREDKYQLPSFKKLLKQIAELYKNNQTEINLQNSELKKMLNPMPFIASDLHLNIQPLQHAQQVLKRNFDSKHGGFGNAPKFPQPSRLEFLFTNESFLVFQTLMHMAIGGIHDQLGGGFFRYSVDANWRIPHFEKMLYDNAQLLFLYSIAFKIQHESIFSETANAAANWIMNKMQSAEGGYYASIDADSEGHEGKYYVWNKNEISSLLTPNEFAVIENYYGLNANANFENHWHLFIATPLEMVADNLKISLENAKQFLDSANKKLLLARENRIAPTLDKKILTAWNALTIKAMFTAGKCLNQPKYIESAQRALAFIKNNYWINQRLLATQNKFAYLDDYAFLLDALITSLQISWNTEHLIFAIELCEAVLKYFSDEKEGGFYFTANDSEKLLYRPKSMMDEVIPAGNAVAAKCLLILGHLLSETRYIDAAVKTLHCGWPMLSQYPAEHCSLLETLKEYLQPSSIIVIRGNTNEINDWQTACQTFNNFVFAIPNDAKNLPDALQNKTPMQNTCAYICEGMKCLDVITDKNKLFV